MKPPEEPNYVVLTPYDPREGMTLKQAADRAGKSETTVKNWCLNRGIGRRVAGGVWVVSRPALEMLLDDDHAALLAYHSGDRSVTSPVQQYFERTGVPCGQPKGSRLKPDNAAKAAFLAMPARSAG